MIMAEEMQHSMDDEMDGMIGERLSLGRCFRRHGLPCQNHITQNDR